MRRDTDIDMVHRSSSESASDTHPSEFFAVRIGTGRHAWRNFDERAHFPDDDGVPWGPSICHSLLLHRRNAASGSLHGVRVQDAPISRWLFRRIVGNGHIYVKSVESPQNPDEFVIHLNM